MLIIGTIGVSTSEKKVIESIINEGVNVLRFNFAHGNTFEFEKIIKMTRGENNNVHILQDLSGKKIRVSGKLKNVISVKNKEKLIFCGYDSYKEIISNYKDVKIIPLNIRSEYLTKTKFTRITMKDNTMEFRVLGLNKSEIITEVLRGGVIRKDKGCNIKNIDRSKWPMSDKDKIDLDWGIDNLVDIICQSYVETPRDITDIKEYINNRNSEYSPTIYAKIESKEGVRNLNGILKEVDGIVLGRGDLVAETSLYNIPIIQDKVVELTKKAGKKIIIATHLLSSMKNNFHPEVPEIESIYYEIKNGIDGFLLAGEISTGKNPIRIAKVLKNIINMYKKK